MKWLLLLVVIVGCDTSSLAPVATLSEYHQIKDGMNYAEVKAIVGEPGVEEVRSKFEGAPGVMEDITTVSYRWSNWDGGNMSCMFQNDKMNMKAQFGLD